MKLREHQNKDIISYGLIDNATIDYVRDVYKDVKNVADLKNYAMLCQAAFLRVLRDANAMVLVDQTPVAIDISRGGGELLSNATGMKRFNSKKVFDIAVGIGRGYASIHDLLNQDIRLVTADGQPDRRTFENLRTIAAFYKHTFEQILMPDVVEARIDSMVDSFRQELRGESVGADQDQQDTNKDFWWVLGWLAKNVKQIKAIIPERGDFLKTFLIFNPDAEEGDAYKVTPDGLTSGGFVNQYTYMFLISFTTSKFPEAVRAWLSGFGSQVKNPMSCNKLAMTLIRGYGFNFGLTNQSAVVDTCLSSAQTDEDKQNFFAGYGDGIEAIAAELGHTMEVDDTDALNLDFPEADSVGTGGSDFSSDDYDFPEVSGLE
jgi:hypothetical protein